MKTLPATPSDADIVAALLNIAARRDSQGKNDLLYSLPAPARDALDALLAAHAGDPTFAAALEQSVKEGCAVTRAAQDAFKMAACLFDTSEACYNLGPAGAWPLDISASRLAVEAAVGLSIPPPALCSLLGACGVKFQAKDLLLLAKKSRAPYMDDPRWALIQLGSGAYAGPPPDPLELASIAKEFCESNIGFWGLRAGDAAAMELAGEFAKLKLAGPDSLAKFMAHAASRGSAADCERLASFGAQWDPSTKQARAGIHAGLRSILKKAPPESAAEAASFIERMAALGAAMPPDATLPADAAFVSPHGGLYPEAWHGAQLDASSRAAAKALSPKLVEAGFGLDDGGGAALREAATAGGHHPANFLEGFELLLELGADPKAAGTRLLIAACGWSLQTPSGPKIETRWLDRLDQLGIHAKDLPKRGPASENPIAHDIQLNRPLAYASLLLDRGAPAHWKDPASGETLATLLAKRCSPAAHALMAKILAKAPARALIDATPADGKAETALMRACWGSDPAMIDILLKAGANPNLLDAAGRTPLHHVARKFGTKAQAKAEAAAKLLIAAGADPGIQAANGLTPAQAMAARGPMGALATLLEHRPQDVAGPDSNAKAAQAKIAKRGGEALSLVEQVVLRAEPAAAAPAKGKACRI